MARLFPTARLLFCVVFLIRLFLCLVTRDHDATNPHARGAATPGLPPPPNPPLLGPCLAPTPSTSRRGTDRARGTAGLRYEVTSGHGIRHPDANLTLALRQKRRASAWPCPEPWLAAPLSAVRPSWPARLACSLPGGTCLCIFIPGPCPRHLADHVRAAPCPVLHVCEVCVECKIEGAIG